MTTPIPVPHPRPARGAVLLLAPLVALLGACASAPSDPAGAAPEAARRQAEAAAPAAWAAGSDTPGAPEAAGDWWAAFGGDTLAAQVELARNVHPSLAAARARVAQARALLAQSEGARSPQLGAGLSALREREAGKSSAQNTLRADLRLAYEADLWGGLSAGQRAGEARWQASQYDTIALRLALDAAIGGLHVELRALDDRLALQQEAIANHRRLLDLLATQKQAGRASALDLARQQAALAAAEAALAPLRARQRQARDALAALLLQPPQAVQAPAGGLAALRLPAAQAGLPAALLSRRPDLRRAEAGLRATQADVEAARAALWPGLRLGADLGREAGTLAALGQPGALVWSVVAELGATLVDGGQRRAEVDRRSAGQEEALQLYLLAAHEAWREVHDALVVIEEAGLQAGHEEAAVQAGREAVRLAELRLQAGAVDLGVVLEARRQLLLNELGRIDAREAQARAHVLLYRAVGGGWDGRLEPATAQAGPAAAIPRKPS